MKTNEILIGLLIVIGFIWGNIFEAESQVVNDATKNEYYVAA